MGLGLDYFHPLLILHWTELGADLGLDHWHQPLQLYKLTWITDEADLSIRNLMSQAARVYPTGCVLTAARRR